jgi:hypothetical protein
MNNMEEKLWDYIDGNCPPGELESISRLIKRDKAYQDKYLELLALNREIAAMELEEPPMAFTYNVMETIRAEHAKQPLKAVVNTHIIKGIAAFFVLTIGALLIYMLTSVKWTAGGVGTPIVAKLPDVKIFFGGAALKGFLFLNTVLALFLIDSLLRKRTGLKQS